MNKFGQLGVGDTNTRFSPTLVALQVTEDENKVKTTGKESGRVIKRIYAYSNCSAGIDAYGLLYTWGSSQVGCLMRSGKPSRSRRRHLLMITTHVNLRRKRGQDTKLRSIWRGWPASQSLRGSVEWLASSESMETTSAVRVK